MKDFEIIEHTADIRIRVYGKSIKDLFKNSALALFNLIIKYKPKAKREREVKLEAANYEELLVNWLNELTSIFYTYKFLPANFKIAIKDNKQFVELAAKIKGEDFNPYENKKIDKEIKAATYCDLKIEKSKKGFSVEIVFDV
ncbi:MAG: archease [Candidatus Omnitrophota bacterium]|nr:archease [Candidatus Omnitrophota bacterium]